MTVVTQRHAMHTQMMWALSQHGVFTYGEVRPIPLRTFKQHDPHLETDCSGMVTCICFAVGAPDPNGLGYDGQGFTGTIANHLPHVASAAELEVGDVILFAPQETSGHVTMVLTPGGDPVCFGFGFQGGPIAIHFDDEVASRRANGNPITPIVFARTLPRSPRKRFTMYKNGRAVAEMNHPRRYVNTHRVFQEPFADIRFHKNT